MTYDESVAELRQAEADLKAENDRHDKELIRLRELIQTKRATVEYAEAGGDPSDYSVALDVLRIRWMSTNSDGAPRVTPEVLHQIERAIEDLRNGGRKLSRQYYGVKSYDRWPSQEVNCEYGMTPSHGHVWFKVGVRYPGKIPTEQERLACIRYLKLVREDPVKYASVGVPS